MSASAKRRRDEAYRKSAELIPAWRGAIARAVRRYELDDTRRNAFVDAARDVGLARLDRGIPTSRRSLDRLMAEAWAKFQARGLRRAFRACHGGAPWSASFTGDLH